MDALSAKDSQFSDTNSFSEALTCSTRSSLFWSGSETSLMQLVYMACSREASVLQCLHEVVGDNLCLS